MARLWAKTVSFESVSVGDQLPILAIWETEETISRFNALLYADGPGQESDEEAAVQRGVAEHTASVPALAAYVYALLEKGFPITGILAPGSHLQIETIQPVRPGDTLTLTGRVVDKSREEDRLLVKCEVVIENQDGQAVAKATAVVCL